MNNRRTLLQLRIVAGLNLPVRDVISSDPYCILTYTDPHYDEVQGHQTEVCYSTTNPSWQEECLLVDVTSDGEVQIEIWDKDVIGDDDPMGRVQLSLGDFDFAQEHDLLLKVEDAERGELNLRLLFSTMEESTRHRFGPYDMDPIERLIGNVYGAVLRGDMDTFRSKLCPTTLQQARLLSGAQTMLERGRDMQVSMLPLEEMELVSYGVTHGLGQCVVKGTVTFTLSDAIPYKAVRDESTQRFEAQWHLHRSAKGWQLYDTEMTLRQASVNDNPILPATIRRFARQGSPPFALWFPTELRGESR